MSFAILFHLLCAQHVSNINISIIRNLNYHIGRLVLSSLFVGDLVRLVLSGGNSTTQSQAPDDGYIKVRNTLST